MQAQREVCEGGDSSCGKRSGRGLARFVAIGDRCEAAPGKDEPALAPESGDADIPSLLLAGPGSGRSG